MARATKLVLLTALIASVAGAQMGPPGGGQGRGGGGRGGPRGGGGEMGQRFGPRAVEPIKRAKFDKAVTALFRAADSNRDGTITLDEVRAVIDARRDAVIRARFTRIDTDKNGSLDFAEFSAWQQAMGSVALSDAQAIGRNAGPVAAVIAPELGNDPEDRVLARLIEPLGATVIVDANTNYDAGVTPAELLAYEDKRFDAADGNHDGEVSMEELRSARGSGDGGFGERR